MGVSIPNLRWHTDAWEPVSPTPSTTPKNGSLHPKIEGPYERVGVPKSKGHSHGCCTPNLRSHTETWESVSPSPRATPKRGSLYAKLKGPQR